jgi:trimeric autotransporter adhesin
VSDSRVKENVRTYDSGLDKVLQIEPKLFDYNGKAGFEKTKDNVGIIAQEIKKILPETVNTYKAKLNEGDEEETELYSYDGHALTFALVNSIKELNKKIEKLETRIQTLEQKQL